MAENLVAGGWADAHNVVNSFTTISPFQKVGMGGWAGIDYQRWASDSDLERATLFAWGPLQRRFEPA